MSMTKTFRLHNPPPSSCSPACRCSSTIQTSLCFSFTDKRTSEIYKHNSAASVCPRWPPPPPHPPHALPDRRKATCPHFSSFLTPPPTSRVSLSFSSRVLTSCCILICRRYFVTMLNSCSCLLSLRSRLFTRDIVLLTPLCDWEKGLHDDHSSSGLLVGATVWQQEVYAAKWSGFKYFWTLSNRYYCEERVQVLLWRLCGHVTQRACAWLEPRVAL